MLPIGLDQVETSLHIATIILPKYENQCFRLALKSTSLPRSPKSRLDQREFFGPKQVSTKKRKLLIFEKLSTMLNTRFSSFNPGSLMLGQYQEVSLPCHDLKRMPHAMP